MLYTIFLFAFVIVAVVLMVFVLLQPDKKGLSGASVFGSTEGSAFGGRETVDFLHRWTVYLGITFFVLALVIGFLSKSEFQNNKETDASSIIMERGKLTPSSSLPAASKQLPVAPAAEQQPAQVPAATQPAPTPAAGK